MLIRLVDAKTREILDEKIPVNGVFATIFDMVGRYPVDRELVAILDRGAMEQARLAAGCQVVKADSVFSKFLSGCRSCGIEELPA